MSYVNFTQDTILKHEESRLDLPTVKRFVWTFILPSLCLFGIVTNTINFVVFKQRKKLKNIIYRYLLWHSVADIVYLSVCFIRFIIKLDIFSSIHLSYWAQMFEVYAYIYIAGSLAVQMIFIELLIAIKRLLIIMNFNLTYKLKFRTVVIACVVFVLLALTPFPLSLRVVDQRTCNFTADNLKCSQDSKHPIYAIAHANIFCLSILRSIYYAGSIFRALIAPLLLLTLNIAIAVKFRQMCIRKRSLTISNRLLLSSYRRKFKLNQFSLEKNFQ